MRKAPKLLTSKLARQITPAEVKVLNGVILGHSDKFIAGQLGLSIHTVKNHVRHLFEKVGGSKRSEMALMCFAHPEWFKDEG